MTFDQARGTGSVPPLPASTKPSWPGALASGTRILCLMEDPAFAERDILPVLREAGVAAETISLGSHEIDNSLIHLYHAILFDVDCKNSASFQVCRQVRNISGMPVMLILHGAAREEILHAYRAGADVCILAPFDPREFLARLGGLLRRKPCPYA